jgi:hypothetical protein
MMYSIRIQERELEEDPSLATVMYSLSGPEGPWYDMVSGSLHNCNEVLDSLFFFESKKEEKVQQSLLELREEINKTYLYACVKLGNELVSVMTSGSDSGWDDAIDNWNDFISKLKLSLT